MWRPCPFRRVQWVPCQHWTRSIYTSRSQLQKRNASSSSSSHNNSNRDDGDPYPHLAIRHSAEAAIDSSYPNLPPIARTGEETEQKRRRLTYQSRKRGILETDLLLSTFAKVWLPQFDRAALDEYDQLLDEPDWDIFYWATNMKPIPERWRHSKILQMVSQHAKNEEKKVLRMPDLE